MNGLDYAAQIRREREASARAAVAKAKREAPPLEPAFPYRATPFRPADFGAVPVAQIPPAE